jgi:hypothetical protein
VLEHSEAVTTGEAAVSKSYYERRAQQIVQEAKTNKKAPSDTPEGSETPPRAFLEPQGDKGQGKGSPKPLKTTGNAQALAKVIQMPLWPEAQRAAPTVMLRSALFAVAKKGSRHYLKKQQIASWPGTTIRYTGMQLDQFDETVWLELVHMAAEQSRNGTIARFTFTALLRRLGLAKHGAALKRLDEAFTRMIACEIDINAKSAGFEFRANMLGLFLEKATGLCTVSLNPKLAALYETGFTRIECTTRKALRSDLAKWLHGFVLSHRADEKKPQYVTIAELKALSGVSAERGLKEFRREVRRAMAQLMELRIVSSWRITENDALGFTRPSKHHSTN